MLSATIFSALLIGLSSTSVLAYPADLQEAAQHPQRTRDAPLAQIASESAAASGGAAAGAALGAFLAAFMMQQLTTGKAPVPPEWTQPYASVFVYVAAVGLVSVGAGTGAALATCVVALLFGDKSWPWVVSPVSGIAASVGSALATIIMGGALVVVVLTVFREEPVENAQLIVFGTLGAALASATLLVAVPPASAVAAAWTTELTLNE